ncbi:hypothetical protein BAUCODRAFT_37277 [Baudoinia panamericana UAMH 10762]|uniref:Uncharacterized protein n=1 Tax=Baudoinia panamericana (strain UAMH 10762) TaxID=717646 RepID=M2MAV3_BAUPA|nr:uncharacterized protein BAUCODRAFT_37277 [Baudoinia panamericana UAMH 10762]EMC93596.1 hypothetical protein BAUCODRAFT_37277 [Baudoinia panamericana UAMH 10762]
MAKVLPDRYSSNPFIGFPVTMAERKQARQAAASSGSQTQRQSSDPQSTCFMGNPEKVRQSGTSFAGSKTSARSISPQSAANMPQGDLPNEPRERRKSSLGRLVDKTVLKLNRRPSGAESLPNDEDDFQRQKAKEVEQQRRKEEYERLGLGERTTLGTPGAGGWRAG